MRPKKFLAAPAPNAQSVSDTSSTTGKHTNTNVADKPENLGKIISSSNEWSLKTDITKWAHRYACDMISIVITRERSYSMASYYNVHSHIKEKFETVKETLKNQDYLFEILDSMINKRRKKIEEIPSKRDINRINVAKNNVFRPMTDIEIRANLLDSFQDGIDTLLHPIVIELQRCIKNPCEIAGHRFEAGTVIHINTNGRFYKKNESKDMNNKVRHKFSLLIFGGGLRICSGRRLAIIELLSLMVILIGKYDVELVDLNAPLKAKSTATTTCEELPIKIKPRK
ncbi:cytochrome P450 [Gigaspora rosea]|uniref:Cytochrome P450 n=1 Tax=Gigaspora rosea TaxID=44941 RepID=A0A397VP11_9GLOM|nr:cytochrome P450 [Gigaspora rosea]